MRRDRSVSLLHREPSPAEPSRRCVDLAAQELVRRSPQAPALPRPWAAAATRSPGG
jgi:hypothetical protein